MPVTKGNVSSTSANTSGPLAWSHTVPAGSNLVLVVGVCLDDNTSGDTVVFNTSESLTLLRRDVNAGAGTTEIWFLVNPTVTTANISVELIGPKAQQIGGAVDFAGADTPDNETGSVPDGVTSVSDTVSGSDADNFIFDCIREPGGAPTAGADQTADWNVAAGGERGGGSTQDGVNGGVMSWSAGASTDWAHTACRIPEAVVADISSESSVSSVSSVSSMSSSSQRSFVYDLRRMRFRPLKTL